MRQRGGFHIMTTKFPIRKENCMKRDRLAAFSENTYRMPKDVTISFINSVASLKYQCIDCFHSHHH